ncbi:M56 family metallopeptidase [Robiginitalea sp. SC105]|uniref:M56 family metallopeptidase n=1 Tax=Robiginitalea sp. SC105 TaxID=2762332 RepID=UPI00163B37BB|nr:M56 family metallopeptidase [Robiginitalea sp. SC105]MBC2838680.1 M56 family metallopeptidase [Robiginitalea sp. SC105]
MVPYLIKSTACLLVFYLFYLLLLERQSNHGFKRFYLVGTLLAGLGIPLVPLVTTASVVPPGLSAWTGGSPGGQDLVTSGAFGIATVASWGIYALGVGLFGFFFLRNLYRLILKTRHNQQIPENGHTKVLLEREEPPHTFFRYLYLHGPAWQKGTIPSGVLAHEEAHIRQRHSLDLIFAEVLLLVIWINPVLWLYRHAIRLNHEFLADREVLRQGYPEKAYQHALLAFTHSSNQPALTHAIHYSSIKKRIKIMKNSTSASRKWLTCLVLIPLSALLFYSFSDRRTVYTNPPAAETSPVFHPREAIDNADLYSLAYPEQPQKGATREEMRQYEKLARKYNQMIEAGGTIEIRKEDVALLKRIYARMSDKQREDTEPFPNFPPPPPPPPAPGALGAHPASHAAPAGHPAPPAQPASPGKVSRVHPPAPAPPPGSVGEAVPPPPPPPDPGVHLKHLASRGADFFYNDKPVSAKEALDLYNRGRVHQIDVQGEAEDTPQVRLMEK